MKKGLDITGEPIPRGATQSSSTSTMSTHGKFAIIAPSTARSARPSSTHRQTMLAEFGRQNGLGVPDGARRRAGGLDWFFDQWVNSNKCLSYEIAAQTCDKKDAAYVTEVQVKCLGSLKMPVPCSRFVRGWHIPADFHQPAPRCRYHPLRAAPRSQVRLDPEGSGHGRRRRPRHAAACQLIGDLPWTEPERKPLGVQKAQTADSPTRAAGSSWAHPYDGKYYRGLKPSPDRGRSRRTTHYELSPRWSGRPSLRSAGPADKAVACYSHALELPESGTHEARPIRDRARPKWVQTPGRALPRIASAWQWWQRLHPGKVKDPDFVMSGEAERIETSQPRGVSLIRQQVLHRPRSLPKMPLSTPTIPSHDGCHPRTEPPKPWVPACTDTAASPRDWRCDIRPGSLFCPRL
jgi:hypothetical protein